MAVGKGKILENGKVRPMDVAVLLPGSGGPSSPGWKMNTIVPGSWFLTCMKIEASQGVNRHRRLASVRRPILTVGACSKLQILHREMPVRSLIALRRRFGQNPGQTSAPVHTMRRAHGQLRAQTTQFWPEIALYARHHTDE